MRNWRNVFEEEVLEAEENSRFVLNYNENDWGDVKIPSSYEEIIEHIVLAQVASDGGKYLPRFRWLNTLTEEAFFEGYDVKDFHILSAILGILSLECQDSVNFFLVSDWEVYGEGEAMDSIVYFEWNGFQISFHSFSPVWKKVNALFGSSETEWDRESSPYTCLQMISFLQECGKKEWTSKESEIEALLQFADNEDNRLERVISVKEIDGVTARMYLPEMGVHHSYTMIEIWGENPYFVID